MGVDLDGRLREIPSRSGFGGVRNDDLSLIAAKVDTWGELVFVNPTIDAEPLGDFLEGVPDDIEWCGPDEFRCTYNVALAAPMQLEGRHRRVQRDVSRAGDPSRDARLDRRRQLTATIVGPARQARAALRHGEPAAARGATAQEMWAAFVRRGDAHRLVLDVDPARYRTRAGESMRDCITAMVRDRLEADGCSSTSPAGGRRSCSTCSSTTSSRTRRSSFTGDLLRDEARAGHTPDDTVFDMFYFERTPSADTPHQRPIDLVLAPGEAHFGLVFEQDVDNLSTGAARSAPARASRT